MRTSFSPAALIVAATLVTSGFAGVASAKTCEVKITANDAMKYNKKEMTVSKKCTDVKVTFENVGKLPRVAMGHDWVLAPAKDMASIASAGLKAGLDNDYQPKNDKRIVAATKVLGPGGSATVTFKLKALKKGVKYNFFCTFPGHVTTMHGPFKVK